MSTKKETTTESKGKFSLTRKIAALLKLGDDGKLDSFFDRTVKQLKKEKTLLSKNIENLKFNHSQKMDDFDDKIEDLETALEEAFMHVDIDRIKTNESQKDYVDIYLENISRCKTNLDDCIKRRKEVQEKHEKGVKEIEEQILSLEKSISKISKQ